MTDPFLVRSEGPAVSIDGGLAITVRPEDRCEMHAMDVWVDGAMITMPAPWPEPVPIPGTPYEAYALGEWAIGLFAIRLRNEDQEEGE